MDEEDPVLGQQLPAYLAYWFLPLPDPMGLPPNYQAVFNYPQDFGEYLLDREEAHEAGTPKPGRLQMEVSLRFWQQDYPWDDDIGIRRLLKVARDAFPTTRGAAGGPLADAPSYEEQNLRQRSTIVEAAVIFTPRDDPPDEGEVSDAFDRALECIQRLQKAYSVVQQWPMRLVTRETLPFTVPWAMRTIMEESDGWPEGLSLYLLHRDIAAWVDPGQLNDEELGALDVAVRRDEGPFASYTDLRREAFVALHRRGDYRTAVLMAAIAAEMFLDDLLLHMMWEDAVRPEDAAAEFADPRVGVIGRVKPSASYPPSNTSRPRSSRGCISPETEEMNLSCAGTTTSWPRDKTGRATSGWLRPS